MKRYRIKFPPSDANELGQDQAFFYLNEDPASEDFIKLRFHDYAEIYNRPGLYEQIFYDRLRCSSPKVVGELLRQTVEWNGEQFSERRVLDLGAGNGIMGETLKGYGVARLVGADIIPEARNAAWRDRPFVYDDYIVADFTNLDDKKTEEINEWSFDCLTCVAALGFGDIPTRAFLQALDFVKVGGWAAFNIKDTFLDNSDKSGFSRLIRELIFSEYLDIHLLQRYRHRLSMDGYPLFYYAMIVGKSADIPKDFLRTHEIDV
ncbi:class I SAM-dependent DNA methyltransferase [Stratiformator vulcanicus]|uniref:Methyltransferase domain protein n=1 Tax=Stratiformator vulcanicus TaxID=2527980 RepID=A0A517R7E9_9PLAN|nr:class I SAM-dependent methyltransferase [Stratiformator vulcanicus]QDT39808.1 Methyltransferase domain protein [Stratiformator vulcanicus]